MKKIMYIQVIYFPFVGYNMQLYHASVLKDEGKQVCHAEGNGKYAWYSMHKYGHETGRLHC